MSTYSTWVFYSETYHGSVPEAVYQQKAILAAMEIDRLTMGKAITAPATMTERLSLCECHMVDVMAASDALGLAPGVTSMSNDGLSVSMGGSAASAQAEELAGIARSYLIFPENLLFCGAVVRDVHV